MNGKLLCHLSTFIRLIRTKRYIPHVFRESNEHSATLLVTDDSFKETDSWKHLPSEKIVMNATVRTIKCKYCGHEESEWFRCGKVKILT